MSVVLGIDVSSYAIDFVTIDEDTGAAAWTRHGLVGATAFDRCRDVPAAMPPPSFYDDVYLIAIETPKTRFLKSAGALFPVYGAVTASLPRLAVVWDVHPTAWRQTLGLPGNASKDECAAAVERLRGDLAPCPTATGCDCVDECDEALRWKKWPQDAYDAYAVAHYARTLNQRGLEAA